MIVHCNFGTGYYKACAEPYEILSKVTALFLLKTVEPRCPALLVYCTSYEASAGFHEYFLKIRMFGRIR